VINMADYIVFKIKVVYEKNKMLVECQKFVGVPVYPVIKERPAQALKKLCNELGINQFALINYEMTYTGALII